MERKQTPGAASATRLKPAAQVRLHRLIETNGDFINPLGSSRSDMAPDDSTRHGDLLT